MESKVLPQFISLDLTISWNSTAPAWAELTDGPAQYASPAAFSSDEQTLFVFHIPASNSPPQYNVKTNTWNKSTALFQDENRERLGAVTDPRTGLIYIAGGYRDDNLDVTATFYMDIFDPVSQSIHPTDLPDPSKVFPHREWPGFVWSKHKNSIIFWGGRMKVGDTSIHPEENDVVELYTDSDSDFRCRMVSYTLQQEPALPFSPVLSIHF
jgi:hypothetical protein